MLLCIVDKRLMNGWMNINFSLWILSKLFRQPCASELCSYSVKKVFADQCWPWTTFWHDEARTQAFLKLWLYISDWEGLSQGPGCRSCFPRSRGTSHDPKLHLHILALHKCSVNLLLILQHLDFPNISSSLHLCLAYWVCSVTWLSSFLILNHWNHVGAQGSN